MQQPDETSGKFKVTSDSILILKGKFGEARCELRNSTAAKSEACGAMQREEDFGSAASSRLRIYSKLWFHGTSGLRGRITRVLNENGFWQSSTGNAASSIQSPRMELVSRSRNFYLKWKIVVDTGETPVQSRMPGDRFLLKERLVARQASGRAAWSFGRMRCVLLAQE